jgi:uncharacterized membrane protein
MFIECNLNKTGIDRFQDCCKTGYYGIMIIMVIIVIVVIMVIVVILVILLKFMKLMKGLVLHTKPKK